MTESIARQLLGLLSFTLAGAVLGFFTSHNLILGALFGSLLWSILSSLLNAKLVTWLDQNLSSPDPKLPFEQGRIVRSIANYRNKTEAEYDEIHADMDQFQAATSAMKDAIVIIDNQDNIEWWNNAAEEILEITIEQKHKRVQEVFSEPNFLEFYSQSSHIASFKADSADQKRVLEYRVESFGEGDKVLIVRDISESEKIGLMRHTFLANASHELRTPITVIHGYLETLQEQELPNPIQKAIHSMQSQSSRMAALIADLLTLSRLETSSENKSRKPIFIREMLERITEEAKEVSGPKQHQISLEMDQGFEILGNEGEVRSALSNLVFNAVRYTPANGVIDIKLKSVDTSVLFSVTDTGVGIPAEHIPRITERFYRVDEGRSRDSGGTGLGLAIVKHVLVRHNAKLGVTSKPGEGSRFSVTFPESRVVKI
ncbi:MULTISPECIES: phosphate regulon sensor histidine kinase PhoR [unclassified Marinobacterium]|uniref:phosphate regulon sensor histidine kinase PhoR n=1 Tax=unclassified Marinobacterium TaxID=2644139 RepID=UPI00156850FC|nr:Phosphate regulon sensor protein PhoR [Marinobacterium sp. xm-v-242]NRP76981.1 Phosphate regulon sensor protein PhoR [Marinobacterium sp. xm-m-383]